MYAVRTLEVRVCFPGCCCLLGAAFSLQHPPSTHPWTQASCTNRARGVTAPDCLCLKGQVLLSPSSPAWGGLPLWVHISNHAASLPLRQLVLALGEGRVSGHHVGVPALQQHATCLWVCVGAGGCASAHICMHACMLCLALMCQRVAGERQPRSCSLAPPSLPMATLCTLPTPPLPLCAPQAHAQRGLLLKLPPALLLPLHLPLVLQQLMVVLQDP